ncbi:C3a anaphylatoxin chemotactic receptor-like isoform X2 [Puntigrus tetrazona]|uniref:C3a anaphylatoxin chemotactic receptor-like isoform X2 n=1 Tax=Puntigrus tetrazona TaxID=1606681 RepID=UPI001C8A055B|nr:C3a anaphylatoxin chemotactic receptor-like isoform X2 [Puntigrus tetrazona]
MQRRCVELDNTPAGRTDKKGLKMANNSVAQITNSTQTDLSGIEIFNIFIYFVVFAVGIVGNGLVIYVTGYKMKTTVNSIWFLNLAIADFIFILIIIFYIVRAIKKVWLFGDFMCKFVSFVAVLNMFASIFLLTAISLDRCLSTWVIVWAQNKRTLVKARIICSLTFLVGFLIPFLIIASSYIAIGVRAKRLKRGKKLKPFRVIISVILAFFICWFPFHFQQLSHIVARINGWTNAASEFKKIGPFVNCVAHLNSCLNPILYVFMCEEFKKKLKQSLLLVLETAFAEEHLPFRTSRPSTCSRLSESQNFKQNNETIVSSGGCSQDNNTCC